MLNYFLKGLLNRRKQAIVLIYHRVIDLKKDSQLLSTSPENFKEHLIYLKERYNIVSLSNLIAALLRNQIKDETVAITFDDGYFDNYVYALPILEEIKIPATIFVSNCNIDTKNEFYWDEIENIFSQPNLLSDKIDLSSCNIKYQSLLKDGKNVNKAYHDICRIIKPLNSESRAKVISYIRDWASSSMEGSEVNRSLSLNELKKLASSEFIEIGGHTVNHVSLSSLTAEEQYAEIKSNIAFLEKQIGYEIKLFSYPFGTKSDFNSDTINALKSLGFASGIANIQKNVTSKSNIYSIPRRLVRNWNIGRFKENIEKYFRNEFVDVMK